MERCLLALWLGFTSLTAAAQPPWRGGAVATASPLATHVALEMLEAGGNAVDATVAATLVLAVVGPQHASIGGGGFVLWHDARSGKTRVLDFREVAPRAASRDMYLREGKPVPELSRDGALAVAVPGSLAGLEAFHRAGGRLPWRRVLVPAVRAARAGFLVTPLYLAAANERLACLRKDPEAARIFLARNTQGTFDVPALGTQLRQPDLARTLESVAAKGSRGFYQGPVAASLVQAVRAGGGVLATEDLATYQPRWRTPLEGHYRGYRILTMPPPSAGGVTLLQTLGVLERRFPQGFRFHDADALHVYVEALRHAFAERARYLGDPAFVAVPLDELLSEHHLDAIAQGIDLARATPSSQLNGPLAKPAPADRHTTHLSVVDRDGNAVALTHTHNYFFGACLVAPGTGVLLNDEMDDFAAAPGAPNTYGLVAEEANTVAPGKVPLSSMTPTFVFQRDRPQAVLLVVGAPGGSTIPTTVVQIVSNVLDAGMNVVQAVTAGRLHHQFLPDELWIEPLGLEPATLRALEGRGHHIREHAPWGSANVVRVDPDTGLRSAASDPRAEGLALGED
jgi:gamma-glutamyltranspeptidase/glutathione hydrolase